MARHLVEPGVEDERGAADGPRDRSGDLVDAAAVDDQALELLVDLRASRESVVLLVHEPGRRTLRDRDERHS